MPQPPDDTDPHKWHRYFAMQSNNRGWALTVQSRSPAEDLEMLNAAHSAAMHWGEIGTELHHMRALMLLAEVHALLGMGASALRYAQEMRNYFTAHDCPDWETAYAHSIHAHAAWAAGEKDVHRLSYVAASEAIDMITEEEDRKLVLQTFEQIPAA